MATPIGNLEDITLRALKILALVDTIAAEDTRITARLLEHHHVHGNLRAVHEHNEQRSADWIVGIRSSIAPDRFCSSRTIWQIFCNTRNPSGRKA